MLGDPRLAKKCYADHKERGLFAGMQGEKEIKPCHCGLYNLSWPIIVSGKPVGTILAGQKLIANKLQESEEIFQRFLSENKESRSPFSICSITSVVTSVSILLCGLLSHW